MRQAWEREDEFKNVHTFDSFFTEDSHHVSEFHLRCWRGNEPEPFFCLLLLQGSLRVSRSQHDDRQERKVQDRSMNGNRLHSSDQKSKKLDDTYHSGHPAELGLLFTGQWERLRGWSMFERGWLNLEKTISQNSPFYMIRIDFLPEQDVARIG